MGQLHIKGDGAAERMETLVPADIQALGVGRARYTMLTNEEGGIRDDLIVSKVEDGLFVVVNAGCRDEDTALIRSAFEPDFEVEELNDRALMALQGPAAVTVLSRLCPGCENLAFMQTEIMSVSGLECRVSRLGYTGEDGYEISVASEYGMKLARTLLASEEVEAAGLGARDSLRLEAGCASMATISTPKPARSKPGFAGPSAKGGAPKAAFPDISESSRISRTGRSKTHRASSKWSRTGSRRR